MRTTIELPDPVYRKGQIERTRGVIFWTPWQNEIHHYSPSGQM